VPSGADQPALSAPEDIQELIKQRAEARAVLSEQLKVVTDTEEWQEYNAEAEFELDVLRSRYANSGEPMTPQRTAQFQAHHRKLQMHIMEQAAEKAAQKFFLGLTSKEREKLRQEFQELEATGETLDTGDVLDAPGLDVGALDEQFSKLRTTLAEKALHEGRMTKEQFERALSEESKAVERARAAAEEVRRAQARAREGMPENPREMPALGDGSSAEVQEKASIEDRLLQMRDRVRAKERESLIAAVERERLRERAERILHDKSSDRA
jgi:hypothetical protein